MLLLVLLEGELGMSGGRLRKSVFLSFVLVPWSCIAEEFLLCWSLCKYAYFVDSL